MHSAKDRRQHTRYELPVMYTRVMVRPMDSDEFIWEGHAYDISEGGLRFELDRGIEPGTPVAIRIDLASSITERRHQQRSVFALANVVWIEEDDESGPRRMAAVFRLFPRAGDQERLMNRLQTGRYAVAA